MKELKPQGIYNHYQQEYNSLEANKVDLNKRLELSISMMVDLILQEEGLLNNTEYISHALFIKEFIKDCPIESKLKIVEHLDS